MVQINLTLHGVVNLIKQEAVMRMPETEWETTMEEEMVIHLFSEQSDSTMSKAAMEIRASTNPTVATLKKKKDLFRKDKKRYH